MTTLMWISFLKETERKNCSILYKTMWIVKKYSEKFRPILDTLVSGSPLVQDGKLIGAVTHVLVNDPTMVYGIFIENMLEAAG